MPTRVQRRLQGVAQIPNLLVNLHTPGVISERRLRSPTTRRRQDAA
jgi:hypothetical protein